MLRVVIADDSVLIREGVQHLLEPEPEIEIVAVANDGEAALEAVERTHPDVVVTDIRMPPGYATEGIELSRQLQRSHPLVGVIAVSQYAHLQYALDFFETGTDRRGYLLKDGLGNREQLVLAIKQVAAGTCVIDPVMADVLFKRGARRELSALRDLTLREREVMAEIAAGRSNSAIARDLVITKRAVEQHVSAIFAKLGLPREQEASRRVTAALLFLADRRHDTTAGEDAPGVGFL